MRDGPFLTRFLSHLHDITKMENPIRQWSEAVKRSPNIALFICCMVGVVICLIVIVTATLSSRESLLLSLVLTIVSMLGSWLASRFYAETSFNENLRTFALKAAEKVDNLSKELDRLAVYLQQELDDDDYKNA